MFRNLLQPIQFISALAALAITAASLAACAAPASPPAPVAVPTTPPVLAASAPTSAATADPFVYCAAVGNADTPGPGYTGPKVPDAVIKGLQKAAGIAADTPAQMLHSGTFWRCMDGKVYACFVGANLPCDSKANTDRTPTAAIIDFCKANLNAGAIPAAVTGHATIYAWRCNQGAPAIDKQVYQVDPRGFIVDNWYPISPQ
jgi:hypothetical protein